MLKLNCILLLIISLPFFSPSQVRPSENQALNYGSSVFAYPILIHAVKYTVEIASGTLIDTQLFKKTLCHCPG